MRAFQTFSTTANDNASGDPSINWANGQAAGSVNDSARAQMAREAALFQGISGGISLGGSSNAYTFTSPSGHALTAYPSHLLIVAKANHTNTGAATLNVDGLGTKSIVKSASTALAAGDIVSGAIYLFSYDGTNFQVIGSLGTAYQPLDADLTAIAALSTTSFGRALLTSADGAALRGSAGATTVGGNLLTLSNPGAITFLRINADNTVTARSASEMRSDLSLGTAATVNTGTSGATIPLLNGANTWSAAQTFSAQNTITGTGPSGIIFETDGPTNEKYWRWYADGGDFVFVALNDAQDASGSIFGVNRTGIGSLIVDVYAALRVNGSTVWHAGNDGAGSGLDADLLDGLQGSAYAQISSANDFASDQRIVGNASLTGGDPTHRGDLRIISNPTSAAAVGGIEFKVSNFSAGFGWKIAAIDPGGGTPLIIYHRENSASWTETLRLTSAGAELSSGTFLGAIRISTETSGTLTSASRNRQVHCSGNITLPASGMSDGDVLLIDPRGTARTITRPAGHTMYVGDVDVATATSPAHNLVSAKFCGGSKWVLQGTA